MIYHLSTNSIQEYNLDSHLVNEVLTKHFYDLTSFYNNLENKIPDIIIIDFNYSYLLSATDIYNHIKNIPIYSDVLILFLDTNNEINDHYNKLELNEDNNPTFTVKVSKNEIIKYISLKDKLKRIKKTNLTNNQKIIINNLNVLVSSNEKIDLQAQQICDYLCIGEVELNKIIKLVFNKSLNQYLIDLKLKNTDASSILLNILSIENNDSVKMNNHSPIYYINEEELYSSFV